MTLLACAIAVSASAAYEVVDVRSVETQAGRRGKAVTQHLVLSRGSETAPVTIERQHLRFAGTVLFRKGDKVAFRSGRLMRSASASDIILTRSRS